MLNFVFTYQYLETDKHNVSFREFYLIMDEILTYTVETFGVMHKLQFFNKRSSSY
jgi:hypothetical protein